MNTVVVNFLKKGPAIKTTAQSRLWLGFGAKVAFFILVTTLANSESKHITLSEQWVSHTHQVLRSIEELESELKDAETGQRGYLLTSNIKYLEPYATAIVNLPLTTAKLKTLTADNPHQQVRIEQLQKLIDIKLRELAQTISLQGAGKAAEALEIVQLDLGKDTMDKILSIAKAMAGEENRLLDKRTADAYQTAQSSTQLIYATTLLTFLTVGMFTLLTSRSISAEFRQLQATEKSLATSNQELQNFVYRTSHDFKSPLLGIKSMASFIEEDIKLGNREESLINITRIHKNVDAALAVVSSTLSLVKTDLGVLHIEVITLSELSQEIVSRLEGFAASKKVTIKVDKGFKEMTVNSDVTHLTTIVENLISNGIKYSQEEGDEAFVHIDAHKDSIGSINITISDNGLGIPEKYQAQVFAAFKQFHPGQANGTGLGLYLVKKSVEKLNASITFESSSDGSRFNINLPIIHP